MKILIISDGIPRENGKIEGIFAFDQAKALLARGHDLRFAVVNVRSFRHKRPYGFRKYTQEGIQVYEISVPLGNIPYAIREAISVKCLDYLYKKIWNDGFHPEIVHSHFISSTSIAAKLKDKYGYKLVATEHFSGFINPSNKNRDTLIHRAQRVYRKVDCMIAVSSYLANVLKSKCGKSAIVIHNIVDGSTFMPQRNSSCSEIVKFISVGRLSAPKNYPFLIEAFTNAYKVRNDIKLEIYGGGELEPQLRQQICKNNMEDVIHLHGMVDRTILAEAMVTSQCFILLSDYETFGVAYIEALASGLPVIATRCGGPEDFVDDSNGMLIDCGNETQALNAILKMCDKHRAFDPLQISNEIKERFSPDRIAEALEKVYAATV